MRGTRIKTLKVTDVYAAERVGIALCCTQPACAR
jgi:hypothetical protein